MEDKRIAKVYQKTTERYMRETGPVLNVLKRALKTRKITYVELGKYLGLSEVGIKKMFQSQDMSLDRMLRICRLLNLRPENIFAATLNRPLEIERLTQTQSDFFVSQPHYFSFYLKLVYEQTSIEMIQKEFELSTASVWKYLKKLDDLGLIKLKEGSKFDLDRSSPMAVDTKGRKEFEDIRRKMARDFLGRVCDEASDRKQVKMSSFKLSEEKTQQLQSDIERLLIRYKRMSEIEKVLGHQNLATVTVLAAMGNFSFISGIKPI